MDIYKRGSRGEVVKQIQKALNLYADGIFGAMTEERVKLFQKEHGLKIDGIVGPATLSLLLAPVTAAVLKLKKSRRNINKIIVHCTATPEGKDYTVADITRWHKQQGWSTIGYHYVIYRDGSIHEGRDVNVAGAHCSRQNSYSIGVCYVGGCDTNMKAKDTRTILQKDALLKLLIDLKKLYPNARIYGHRDFDKGKACPSFDARKEFESI